MFGGQVNRMDMRLSQMADKSSGNVNGYQATKHNNRKPFSGHFHRAVADVSTNENTSENDTGGEIKVLISVQPISIPEAYICFER